MQSFEQHILFKDKDTLCFRVRFGIPTNLPGNKEDIGFLGSKIG